MNAKRSLVVAMALVLGVVFCGAAMAGPVTINNHTFEADGGIPNGCPSSWSLTGDNTGGVHNIDYGLSPRPDATAYNFWSNGATSKSGIYQTTGELLAANTTYTLTLDIGDRNDLGPGAPRIRLGYGNTALVNRVGGTYVGAIPTTGWVAGGWTYTWSTPSNLTAGVGQPLRIELINAGGTQAQYDDVHFNSATNATPYTAVNISITNHTFEDIPIVGIGTPTGWSSNGFHAGGGGVHNIDYGLSPRPDGTAHNFWSNGGSGALLGGTCQVTSESLAANTTYRLIVDVGDRNDCSAGEPSIGLGYGSSGGVNMLGTYIGSTPVTGWETWVYEYSTGANPEGLGQPLRIELRATAAQAQFDNVHFERLSMDPVVPEPAGLGLVGLALLALRRRRS